MARKSAQTTADSAFRHELLPLVQAVAEHRLILFVGGGVSQNLGVPDFKTLVHHMASDLGFAGNYSVADYSVVAEAYLVKHAQLGALRSWMDTNWHPSSINIAKSELHNLIVDLDFPVIYTTNYDRWLEKSFEGRRKPLHKVTNTADLTVPADGRTEIIKFHGDLEDDDSLVLTESSYFQRMLFETPLDIRLRSDSLARPLLFVGYSLHDVNTRYLLFRLQELWKNSPHASHRPMSYILMTERNQAQEIVLKSRGVLPIALDERDPGRATTVFLRDLLREVRRLRRRNRRG
ncbi:SIR2 family protein [Occallatibacter riparius]|uniref:SIR2 family protein n=1 Tax=Occallatibacter riparius TaxID=1002689 RepID=A0A9J7BFV6_9BACT|nr:SIR2 family protein [Occallatibacter riparius]UWZ81656.1 SIR2 family protein [Occallatibacter riparius]